MSLQNRPITKTQMLIRRPVEEVFEAFVDPAITTQFWFTHSTGRLEPGKVVRWDWAMYGASADVHVKAVEPNQRILIEWPDHHGQLCPVEWTFSERPDGTTFVTIANWGFSGNEDEAVSQALDSMGGFSFVLAGLKAWLEQNVALNLVLDHAPDARTQ
ncbi:MAG TPA: SRPBCC family protein [Symbiobacteriaceae bacterium]|nr:SRPBCC family protein [Symbiobacteriaceae bacterium]